jgi:ABC-type Fe3+/spermidine/putrescine transport system ATPase subunit
VTEPGLELSRLTKRFGDHVAVRDLSLTVDRGGILALLGPSGSGKTTTLRLIAGFETADGGTVTVKGRDVTNLSPAQRRFGMVFQHYALFPHLDVFENVTFGLPASMSRADREQRAMEVLGLVDLAGFERRRVTELSGGQQQRVAVARAVAPKPELLLFDEPLSNLDPSLRERTRRELRRAIEQIGVTTVFVTHEQEEAFALGDVVAVLHDGALEQVDTAPNLYERPTSAFVASFVGRTSRLEGRMVDRGHVEVAPGVVWPTLRPLDAQPGEVVAVLIRPEALRVVNASGLESRVVAVRYTGARAFFTVETAVGHVEFEASVHMATVGDTLRLAAEGVHVFRGAR